MAKKISTIEKIRHSLAHLLAAEIKKAYPRVKLGMGPAIENGFYYDFDFGGSAQENVNFLKTQDLKKIEKAMRESILKKILFKKKNISKSEAKKIFKDQPYKIELINDLPGSIVSIYQSGDFIDLCKGPHIKSTDEIDVNAFTLTKTAGAYWRGSEKNPMLTRIYGLAFLTKKELDDYLKQQEEIEKRDHRVLGEKLEIFMIDENIGKGLPLYLPNGYFIRRQLENYIYNIEQDNGYLHVLTPHLAKEGLYKTSGHLAHYKDDMYSPIDIEGEKYYLKPMNCPHHHSIYKHQIRSYKDLPLRIAELGTVYRFERSGVLSGLIRVRGFTQNDAHIYTTPEKLEEEIMNILKLHQQVFKDFKIEDYWYRLSLPDFKNKNKFGDVKNKKMWNKGSNILRKCLEKNNVKFIEAKGEASFYGPKIDIQIKDIHGKEDSIATIQVDYYSSSKFNLEYIDENNKKQPPIIIHRAIFGSFERFIAFLLEKTAGYLPFWLVPVQVAIINIGLKHQEYAEKVLDVLKKNNIRAKIESEDAVSKRIRNGEIKKIPYLLIIGDREMNSQTVSVRKTGKGDIGQMNLKKFLKIIKKDQLCSSDNCFSS